MTKTILLPLFMLVCYNAISQQKNIIQGYLELNLKYIAEVSHDLPPPPPPPPPGMDMPVQEVFPASFPDDGFVVKIWFNPSFEKVVNMIYGKRTFLFNAQNHSTINLHEISGLKIGTIATPEDEEAVRNYMDSLEGRKRKPVSVTRVEYKAEMNLVNGFSCKKALLITETANAKPDTAFVWYYPDHKLPDNFIFSSDKLEHRSRLAALKLINGLPIQVKISLNPKLKLEMELKKMDIKKIVPDKEFEVAKDFKLTPVKEAYGLK